MMFSHPLSLAKNILTPSLTEIVFNAIGSAWVVFIYTAIVYSDQFQVTIEIRLSLSLVFRVPHLQ